MVFTEHTGLAIIYLGQVATAVAHVLWNNLYM